MSYIRVCDLCGKPLPLDDGGRKFKIKEHWTGFFGSSWAYKRGSKSNRSESGSYLVFFCSWGCMRSYDRDNAHVYSRRGRKKVTA